MPRILPVLAVFASALVTFPSHAQNCAPFTDVLASSGFCSNIQWLFNRGITQGCTATQYCPANFVRRDQMAAFLNRLADNLFPLNCAAGQVLKWNGTAWVCAADAAGPANAFVQGGNAFGATAIIGTNDVQALEIEAGNARVMRYAPNPISPNIVGGSPANSVTAGVRGATIAGGGVPAGDTDPDFPLEVPNRVTDAYGTVGGGYANRAGNDAGSTTDEPFATVAGGRNNTASGFASTVSGGSNGTAFGNNSTISGGLDNVANGFSSIVAGGSENTANGIYSFVAGFSNTTSGTASFAAGRGANANFDGCFVWGDSSTDNGVTCGAANRFVARSLGGVYFFSSGNNQATYDGVFLAPGATAWVMASDRRIKDNLQAVDTGDVLQKLVALPITTWNLKSQDPSIRHMGAMAQDFHAAFGLGETELGINTLDADGVALAAIQGLNAKVDAQAREIAGLREQHASELAKLSRAYEELLARIAAAGTVSAR